MAGLLIGLSKPKGKKPFGSDPMASAGKGMMGMEDEAAPEDEGYSAAKDEAVGELAEALGIDPSSVNSKAVCAALRKIAELE